MRKLIPNQPARLAASLVVLIVMILLGGGCESGNQPPVISSVTGGKGWVDPSGSCQVSCVASDPDDDSLSYSWSASEGTISGEGSTVTWTAPEALGPCTITVTVTDGHAGEATMQKTIYVGENHPPVIDSMISEYIQIEKASTCHLKCTAHDPDGDELTYEWTANRGSISGDGPAARWVSPNTYLSAVITAIVTDGRGGKAVQKSIIRVVCCGMAQKNPEWPE